MSNTIDLPIVAIGTNGSVTFDGHLVVVSAKRSVLQSAHDEGVPIDQITKIHTKPAGWRPGMIYFATGETFEAGYNALSGRGGVTFTEKQQPEFVRLYRAVKRKMAGEKDWARVDPVPAAEELTEPEPRTPWWKARWVQWVGGGFAALVAIQLGWAILDPDGYQAFSDEMQEKREAEEQAQAETARSGLLAYLDQGEAAMGPCDRGYVALVEEMGAFDGSLAARTALYQLGEQVSYVCSSQAGDLRAIDYPRDLDDMQEERVKAVREKCAGALSSRAQFADAIKDVAEKGMSPSRNTRVERMIGAAKGAQLACNAARGAIEVAAVE